MSAYRIISVPVEKADPYHPLIYSKWLRSLRYGNDYFKLIDPDSYWKSYHDYISNIICDPNTSVRIAALDEDEDVVLGFSVSRGKVLDYVFVDKLMREKGIGRSLVPKDIESISHLTKTGLYIWSNKFPKWKFNPFV